VKPKDSSASRLVGAEVDEDADAAADVEMEVELGLAEWWAGAKVEVAADWLAGANVEVVAESLEETWRGWLLLAVDEDA
jgi:hypothetical protein